ncbi:DUF962 domain-containing protein [Shewanella litorisediminis]|uniref:DUF962 domain-containing protein n=1 Tax=Shewanella litorisediminis TaxID=1173586 RepID=A0ABX7G6A7_9GAMM|nr:DUF962 domain-containing protein [Shewanella litorisediminis]MCL2916973.1 DUF962 domain-containing protein [Shewanella litorisediminis]QRH02869.1 DUF962 domain-containing protein [Shewanella litorisediminis]
MKPRFSSFSEFYPYYLSEHSHPLCRGLHYLGSSLVLILLLVLFISGQWQWAWLLPVVGYGFAWIGHFFIEKNRPATFRHPWYSFLGDWVMLWDFISGRQRQNT